VTYESRVLSSFVDDIVAEILRAPSLDKSIRLARFLGELLWKNSVGRYQLAKMERALLDRFQQSLPLSRLPRVCRYAHVLTKAYDSGGHTRVVERLVGSVALEDSAVLVVEAASDRARQRLGRAKYGLKKLPGGRRGVARVIELAEEFSRYEELILYIHPHDIETVLAAGLASRIWGARVMLFNHADHVFTYGMGIAERVLEISHFGWDLRGMRKCEDRSVFVGIPLDLPKRIRSSAPNGGTIVSAGTSYKFRPALGWSFPRFAKEFCQRTNLDMQVVGPRKLLDWWWWSACLVLGRRLTLRRRLDYDDYLAFISRASAYVDSFPFVGGTAFAETMGRGVECFGVLTGTHGYSPADLLKSETVNQLSQELASFIRSGKRTGADKDEIYRVVIEVHAVERVAQRVATAFTSEIGLPPPWPCKKGIDIHAFEQVWLQRMLPVVPVHAAPAIGLMVKFAFIKVFSRLVFLWGAGARSKN